MAGVSSPVATKSSGGQGPPGQQRPRDDLQEIGGRRRCPKGICKATVGGMLTGWAVLALAALNAYAQQSRNLSTTVEAGVTYLPPARSGVCEVRRVQFSDTSGWRVREVLVCCTQGRCTSQLTY